MKKHQIILSLLLLLAVSCQQKEKSVADAGSACENFAYEKVIDDEEFLPVSFDNDSIIELENSTITSPVTAKQLLSLSEIHTIGFYSEEVEHTPQEEEALRLVNRFMRMQYLASTTADDEWQWLLAVNVAMDQYASTTQQSGTSHLDILTQMTDVVGDYGGGTQPDMNLLSYILSSVAKYRVLETYRLLMADLKDAKLRDLIHQEFRAWRDWRDNMQRWCIEIDHIGESHSALPLELEGYYENLCDIRLQTLSSERDILLHHRTYAQKMPTVTQKAWLEWLSWGYIPEGDPQADTYADQDRIQLARDIKRNFDTWHALRSSILRHLQSSQATDYDKVSADIHALTLKKYNFWAACEEEDSE